MIHWTKASNTGFQNLVVDYIFCFVIDCEFSHVSAQLLKLFS